MINTIKLKASLLVTALGVLFLAATVFAATNISFSPTTVNVKAGQSFSLVLSINPQGGKNYTIKMGLDYPADLLEVSSFTFGNNWMPLVQSGYDVVDNTNGVFIKTAGYPGGLASNAVFGTVTFIAKKSGSGTIDFNPNESMALDGSNQNVVNGAVVQTLVTVTAVSSPSSTPSQSQSDSLGQSSSSVLNANSNSQS
ncbi:MAG: cohesin domain-containing protein, partial [bacterium]|nr:cohesin domain-containing protein [bacterium]